MPSAVEFPSQKMPVHIIFLTASAVMGVLYFIFFHYSSWIWSFNLAMPSQEYMFNDPMNLELRDGIEVYVLYAMALLNMGLVLWAHAVMAKIKNILVLSWCYVPMAMIAGAFFYAVGFHPPVLDYQSLPMAVHLPLALATALMTALVAGLFSIFYQKWWVSLLLVCLFVWACFVPMHTQWFWLSEWVFFLAPAWNFLHGAPLNELYLQYDYFLTLISALWMKLGLSVFAVRIIPETANFVLLISMYYFARRLLYFKPLAVLLGVTLLLVRIYGGMHDPAVTLQASPLRLDMWLLVLVLAYWKGAHHWVVGVALAAMLVLHHTFGCIYSISYGLFVLFLACRELISEKPQAGVFIRKYAGMYGVNFFLIAAAFLLFLFFLAPEQQAGAALYRKYNIGFLPIKSTSFYWYVFVMIGACVALLWRNRDIGQRYFQTGIFLLLLAVGQSIYFFGRSHEAVIVAISPVLVLIFFLLVDLLHREMAAGRANMLCWFAAPVMAGAFVFFTAYFYSPHIFPALRAQYENLKAGEFFIDDPGFSVEGLDKIISGSKKVVFLSRLDFYYYHAGGYVLPYQHCFLGSFFLRQDGLKFLNDRIAEGYYIVIPNSEFRGSRYLS